MHTYSHINKRQLFKLNNFADVAQDIGWEAAYYEQLDFTLTII